MGFKKSLYTLLVASVLAACGEQQNDTPRTACISPETESLSLRGGGFIMGANPLYAEEGPPRAVRVAGFEIDTTEVTNAQFAKFIAATGYITDAEKPQSGFDVAGGGVFRPPTVRNPNWWHFVEGANWRHPEGPDSSIEGRDTEPVVQVSHADARAYAQWAGRRLPSEAEWEFAANAGADAELKGGAIAENSANIWQGVFPLQNTQADGYISRAPVGCYPPNDFALYDMIGNVWEWTDTPVASVGGEPRYIIKGGSYLCAANFCRRYRVAARQAQEAGLPTAHIGFRTIASQYFSTGNAN